MKALVKILSGLICVALLVVVGAWFYLDRIVQQAVVRIGPQVTGTEVGLASVSVKPLAGGLTLTGLSIGNPEGFAAQHIFTLGQIDLAVDTSTLREDVLVVNHLLVDAPQIAYEATPDGDNLRALRDNIAQNTGAGDAADEQAGAGRKLIVDRLVISGGEVSVSHYLMPDQLVTVQLPGLELTDIGRQSGGATVAEVSAQILDYLSSQAAQAAMNSDQVQRLLDDTRTQIESRLREESGGEAVDQIRGLLESLGR